MFEDSTFESTGRIRTRSRRWMFAAFTFNGSILVALVLVPLIFPNALPHQPMPVLMVVPAAPVHDTPPPTRRETQVSHGGSDIADGHIVAPTGIPPRIKMFKDPEPPSGNIASTMDQGTSVPGGKDDPFGNHRQVTVVRADTTTPARVSSGVMAGLLISKNVPPYPPIAKATGTQGTVVLQATISKSGTIENLHVISGPQMLQQAALDAVRTWRYRPYLLNQQPVEVETTVSVVFTIGR